MSRKNETTTPPRYRGGASEQVFNAIQVLVAEVEKEPTARSENMIWVLKELSEKWTMKAGEIKLTMRGEGYRFSDSTTERALQDLIKKGLARRPRLGVYQASFEIIFLQALLNSGHINRMVFNHILSGRKDQGVSAR